MLEGTTYYWRIVAQNATCGSNSGAEWNFGTCAVPGTPGTPNPVDTDTNIATSSVLDWADSSYADSYNVYFGTTTSPPYVTNVGASTWDPAGLNMETTYYWRIVAVNSACGSITGAEWSFETIACTPLAGTPLTPVPGTGNSDISTSSILNWADSSDTDSYNVYFGTTTSPPYAANVGVSQWDPSGMSPGTTYYWRIVAQNATCGSTSGTEWNFGTCFVPGTPITPAPLDTDTNIGTSSILNWADSSDTDSYNVYFGTTTSPPYAANVAISQWDPSGMLEGTTYYWRIVAQNATCGSNSGVEWSFGTCAVPGTPGTPNPIDTDTDIVTSSILNWADSSYADTYNVYFGTTTSPGFVANVGVSQWDPDGMSIETTYYWRVVAINSACGSITGAEWSFATISCTPTAGTPLNPVPGIGNSDIATTSILNWDDSADTDSYNVYFGTTTSPPYAANVGASQWDPGGMLEGTTYYWRIVAQNATCGSNSGAEWNFSTCTAPGIPGTPNPIDTDTNIGTSSILNWADSSDTDSYNVYFGTTTSPPYAANVGVSQWDPAGMSPGTTYYWRIVAQNATCGSNSGAEWSFSTCAVPGTPGTPDPADTNSNIGTGSVLDWADSSDTDSYNVYFGTTTSPPYVANVGASTWDPSGMAEGTTYYWRIVAQNANCGSNSGAEWSFSTCRRMPITIMCTLAPPRRRGMWLMWPLVNGIRLE
jgi:hypothetical protein